MKYPAKPAKVVESWAFLALALLTVLGAAFGSVPSFYFTDVDTFSLINTGRFHSLAGALEVLRSELMAGRMVNASYYRPFLSLVYGFEFHLFGLNARGYHLVDLAFFLGAALCLVALFRIVFGKTEGSRWGLLAAVLFLLHPLQVENVPGIARLGDILSGFWIIASVTGLLYGLSLKQRGRLAPSYSWIAVSSLLFVLGFSSKEPAIGCLGTLFVIVAAFGAEKKPLRRLCETFLLTTPVLLSCVLFVLWRQRIIEGVGGYYSNESMLDHAAMFAFFVAANLSAVLLGLIGPSLSDDFDRYMFFVTDRDWLLVCVLIGAAILFSRQLVRHWRRLLTTPFDFSHSKSAAKDGAVRMAWVAGSLIFFTAALIWIKTRPNLRYLYIPVMGYSVLLSLGIRALWKSKWKPRTKQIAICVSAVVLLVTYAHCPLWNKERLRRWRIGAELSRSVLSQIETIAKENPSQDIYLFNIPTLLTYGRMSPFFFEIPFNQILLDHSINDYLDMRWAQQGTPVSHVIGGSYVYLSGEPETLRVKTVFTSPTQISIDVSEGGLPGEHPWEIIPGRSNRSELFRMEGGRVRLEVQGKQTWDTSAIVELLPKAQAASARYLAFNGQTIVELQKLER